MSRQIDVALPFRAYFDAGAEVVGVVPSTAEDPGGHRVLSAVCRTRTEELAP